ncbi:PIN domain-like protein [Gymnopus androsaceus JB14]|uniref:PIN domain-like protein n=1 Tax=Gymnopus androsaceus JB14 TaxID=1447944 RepID=A0A6A4HQN2_9AGAR|nr:PIN domain-like protein [Gymnopus androsaceus JB14]
MGIQGLWPILKPIASTQDFAEYALEHGFIKRYHKSRTFDLGIDSSVLLDSFRAAAWSRQRGRLHGPDTSLTQLFRILCQLSRASANCIFVYDGDGRPPRKHGRQVIKRSPMLYEQSKRLVEAFGFHVHVAAGEAEAELAVMNRLGVIHAVLTKDSDVFPYGAQLVLRVNSDACTATNLVVDVYDSQIIEQRLGLTRSGFLLFALLVGNDIDAGISGLGPQTALALAKCGYWRYSP